MDTSKIARSPEHDNHLGDRVDDPLIDRLHWVIRQAIRVLAVLMVAVILWTVADVVLVLYEKLSAPPSCCSTSTTSSSSSPPSWRC